jgi:hypothetical protein
MLLHSKSNLNFLKEKKGYFNSKYAKMEKKPILYDNVKSSYEKAHKKCHE